MSAQTTDDLQQGIERMSPAELRAEIDQIRLHQPETFADSLRPECANINWLETRHALRLAGELARAGCPVSVQISYNQATFPQTLYTAAWIAAGRTLVAFLGASEGEAICRLYAYINHMYRSCFTPIEEKAAPIPHPNPGGWNYRVVCETGTANGRKYQTFSIREVYYTNNIPDSMTKDEVSPAGESFLEFLNSFDRYLKALEKPVLIFDRDNNCFADSNNNNKPHEGE